MNTNRRSFLKIAATSLFVALTARLGLSTAEAAKKSGAKKAESPLPAGQTEVPATDPVGSAIGYVADSAKVDTKKYPQFKKGQECSKCALYVASNDSWGKCQMLTSGLVKAGGWCGSFSPKAAL